ncbi:MAG TPA: hypothetical protein VG538_15350 [Vicinamibacterales bacterium]|nr:hypothetical protein [Vicinamibacterales bacterium]
MIFIEPWIERQTDEALFRFACRLAGRVSILMVRWYNGDSRQHIGRWIELLECALAFRDVNAPVSGDIEHHRLVELAVRNHRRNDEPALIDRRRGGHRWNTGLARRANRHDSE